MFQCFNPFPRVCDVYWLEASLGFKIRTLRRFIIQSSSVNSYMFLDFVTIHHPSASIRFHVPSSTFKMIILHPIHAYDGKLPRKKNPEFLVHPPLIMVQSPRNHQSQHLRSPFANESHQKIHPPLQPGSHWKKPLGSHWENPLGKPIGKTHWDPIIPRSRGFARTGLTLSVLAPLTCGSTLSAVTAAQFAKFPVIGALAWQPKTMGKPWENHRKTIGLPPK